MLAPFQHKASLLEGALGLAAPLVVMFAAPWLYLRFRRATLSEAERRRFLFLVAAGIALALLPFIHHTWQGIVAFTSEGSHEPGYVYARFVSWLSSLIASLFTGFGLAFLFSLPAIYALKRWHAEHSAAASIGIMVIAAMGIWAVAYGLSLLSIWLSVEGHPRWDYWPTQEAVIVLALLAVGAIAAGSIYPRIMARA
jgi:hypothetical protein